MCGCGKKTEGKELAGFSDLFIDKKEIIFGVLAYTAAVFWLYHQGSKNTAKAAGWKNG